MFKEKGKLKLNEGTHNYEAMIDIKGAINRMTKSGLNGAKLISQAKQREP